jgi:hypothetical protein
MNEDMQRDRPGGQGPDALQGRYESSKRALSEALLAGSLDTWDSEGLEELKVWKRGRFACHALALVRFPPASWHPTQAPMLATRLI